MPCKSRERMSKTANVFKDSVRYRQKVPIPSFLELFGEHAIQPLFVFQVLCLILWLLDEYWKYSLMTLMILIVFEGQMVYKRRRDLNMIQGMHMPPCPVAVRRFGKWWKISSVDLVPGDIFSLAMSNDLKALGIAPGATQAIPRTRFSSKDSSIGAPCDALILQGSVIVNEAMLTGESLPQMKYAIDMTAESLVSSIPGRNALLAYQNSPLDMNVSHKNHVLFAGTAVLMESNKDDHHGIGGNVYYCLRTGFETTQG